MQGRKSAGNLLSFFKCVGVRAGNFLLSGHEAKADTLRLARLGRHGQVDALYFYCTGFSLEYIGYTQVGGGGMVAIQPLTHAKPQSDHVQFAGRVECSVQEKQACCQEQHHGYRCMTTKNSGEINHIQDFVAFQQIN